MIRRIAATQLLPGMFVVHLHKHWLEHGFWRQRFLVRDGAVINRLIEDGIDEVSIDTDRGRDVPERPVPGLARVEASLLALAARGQRRPPTISLGEERRRSARLLREAGAVVQDLLNGPRLGLPVDAGRLEPLVGRMIDSVERHPDALIPMARLKEGGAYTAEHAVAAAALAIGLARQQGLAHAQVEQVALGMLLKDIGQVSLDARFEGKAGRLSQDERSLLHNHVEEGLAVLEANTRLSPTSAAVVLEHHERFDGSGYPYRRPGVELSVAGRMAAIVDSYDAMTADRPYRAALSPAAALRQVFSAGGGQFDPVLVAAFVRTVGIYPVGTLVRLESGHLAVVEEAHSEQLLSPVVRVIYHAGRRQYVAPVRVDLARKFGNHYGRIVGAAEFSAWGISAIRWQPV